MRSRPRGRWCARPPPSSGPSHRRRGLPRVQRRLCRFDGASAGALDWLAARPWAASAILLILTLVCFLPGVVALPPVDRTEVVYASTSRAMLERGDLLDAQLEGERFAYRPIGAFWLQAAAASLLGADARDDITTYRLPSLAGAILAVLATYWLLVPLLGGRGRLMAAGLFGITVPVAVQAQLAISEARCCPPRLSRSSRCCGSMRPSRTRRRAALPCCSGPRRASGSDQCARRADPVAVHARRVVRLRSEPRLVKAFASADGPPRYAAARRAMAARARTSTACRSPDCPGASSSPRSAGRRR